MHLGKLISNIIFQRADFAITDLTITAARQKAVDFTSPFMNLGITILYKKPTKQPPNLFSFISPFSYQVMDALFQMQKSIVCTLIIMPHMLLRIKNSLKEPSHLFGKTVSILLFS